MAIDWTKYASSENSGSIPAAPANEKPIKTAADGQGKKIGFFKSTGQWMLLPGGAAGGR